MKVIYDWVLWKIRQKDETIIPEPPSNVDNTLLLSYPEPIRYAWTIFNVADETELNNAITNAISWDIINLTADITLTNTLVINKSIKLDWNFTLSSAWLWTDPVILVRIDVDNVYITKNITISHLKTTNTSVEVAISLNNVNNFISEATVNFIEFWYSWIWSFTIRGNLNYTWLNTNSSRAIWIYWLTWNSRIENVLWDFTGWWTPSANFVFWSTTNYNYPLKVSNCYQKDLTKIWRQFVFFELIWKTEWAKPWLIVEWCKFNCLNWDIWIMFSWTYDLSFLDFLVLHSNVSYNQAYNVWNYKGLFFADWSWSLRSLWTTKCYIWNNFNNPAFRSSNDYTDAIVNSQITFKNTLFTNDAPLLDNTNFVFGWKLTF